MLIQKTIEVRINNFNEEHFGKLRIVSNTDNLPTNRELLKIKNRAFNILKNKKSYIYNIDTKTESFSEQRPEK